MTTAERLRVTGHIKQSWRGSIITTADNSVWVLQPTEGVQLPSRGMVVVEGFKIGFDRLEVNWASQAPSELTARNR
jgi:hypothetical protein